MHNYPSDISREEFKIIREELEGAKKKTRPHQTDLYDVFCAVLYVVKGGIQWRMRRLIFRSGSYVIIIFEYGHQKERTALNQAFSKKF